MDEKKSFFELLDPKSAMVVGLVGGLLSLGTIGFVVLGVMMLKGSSIASNTPAVNVQQIATAKNEPAPPPVVPKSDKPKVELFVMSYCPYGLQMEKAYLPAWDLLKKKADIDLKFVSYAMHGEKEVVENTVQYCIQSEQNDKFQNYLKCFTGSGNTESCQTSAGISKSKLNSCVATTNKKYAILDKLKDQSTWLSGQFPIYPIHEGLNDQYGVQGSPTLVINGTEVQIARTPESVKNAICAAFNDVPAECGQTLSNSSFDPGFGTSVSLNAGGAVAPGCGT
ncbi:MAG: hypothetical protein A3I29_04685 [Candidatus Magasanikbacteria bacterium RIFCSPLOWO2_02_FULL_44_11]|uniref:Thioredoxin-like fold domain-containing protein n=2 Tax=Candidatus Magasanikiibacteriota TaxID=1752731 RepID=A0A1F6N8U4_9BACT|nr:MAG: hypothetical protein A3D53_03350 [Candidatus Magasanikbacteria bacterium RIFCSPHIGHO2_02_FULL_45_10]OGH80304.1 MAG: hypothetical protein A3I29_04685 [Candidatus Magasanikbacteria bacterium RIFCSPLOWO2_02_FULL_44_11]